MLIPFFLEIDLMIYILSPLNPNSPLLVKLTNFSIFPFLSKIFVQNYEVFTWFYRSDIAAWNALLSRASEG